MPKLTKQAYIGGSLKNSQNPKGTIDLPREDLIGWAMRRYIQLYIRFRIKNTRLRKPLLVKAIQDYFNSDSNIDEEVEGGYFWVADRKSFHMGPCLYCQEQEEKFRHTGAEREHLVQIMISEPCLSWHWNSRLGPGVTYSRILNETEANDFGIGIYGSQTPQGGGQQQDGFILTDKMRSDIKDIVLNHIAGNKAASKQQANGQVGVEALQRSAGGQSVTGIQNIGIA